MASKRISVRAYGTVLVWLLGAMVTPCGAGADDRQTPAGIVVEALSLASPLRQAGIQVGDRMISWRAIATSADSDSAAGDLESIFDWYWLEIEWVPRGSVHLVGDRDGQAMEWTAESGDWEAEVHPDMSPASWAAYDRGRGQVESGEVVSGITTWQETAAEMPGAPLSAWLVLRAGQVLADARSFVSAQQAFRDALDLAGDPQAKVAVLAAAGEAFRATGDWLGAQEMLEQAARIQQTAWGDSLSLAASVTSLGQVSWSRGDLAKARGHWQQAFELRQHLAPDSLATAVSVRNLGDLSYAVGNLDAAEARYLHALRVQEQLSPDSLAVAATLHSLGNVALARTRLDVADAHYRRALALRQRLAPDGLEVAASLNGLANVVGERSDFDQAMELFQQSIDIYERIAPDRLEFARCLADFGDLTRLRGDLEGARGLLEHAFALQQRLAPESLPTAMTVRRLGIVAEKLGDLVLAEERKMEGLRIEEAAAPGSLAMANSLNGLGVLRLKQGALDEAVAFFERALELFTRLAPGNSSHAKVLFNLASIARLRGDLSAAAAHVGEGVALYESLAPNSLIMAAGLRIATSIARVRGDLAVAVAYQERALGIVKGKAPESLEMVLLLNSLGSVAYLRGDHAVSIDLYQRALALVRKLAPASISAGTAAMNLGNVLLDLGDKDGARARHLEALAIYEQAVPESLLLAKSLINLGWGALGREELDTAQRFNERALALARRLAPGGAVEAVSLTNLGGVAAKRGQLKNAENLLLEALALLDRSAPQTKRHAETLHALGLLARRGARLTDAVNYLLRAVRALESQIGKLGGTHDLRGDYRASFGHIYRDAIEMLLQIGREEEALELLESYRARSLLAMIAERDIVFTADIPEDLELERRRLAVNYDRTQQELSALDVARAPEETVQLLEQLEQLRHDRRLIEAKIRRESPRLADLQYPRPLTFRQLREAIDPGTVLLSYLVGEEETRLFVVRRGEDLRVVDLDIGEGELAQAINRWRALIEERRNSNSKGFVSVLRAGERLFDLLVAPVMDSVDAGDRLLVVPDGPLHNLPFAALWQPSVGVANDGRYLIEHRPIHTVVSGTVYAQLRDAHSNRPVSSSLVAFGDPQYPGSFGEAAGSGIGPRLRAAGTRFDFPPLPGSRREVEEIAGLYPDRSETYLGVKATEEAAKSVDRATRYVHFAAHGLLDERTPLDSAIVLSLSEDLVAGQDNGLLQVWEIFERLRLDADLVVLSACQSARGEYAGGEGLIGLTRAFQYAGARSVMATLWNVADPTTAALMVHFYRHLRSGASKDEALREAQLALIRAPTDVGDGIERDASAPFYWAGFQLYGDWQ